MRTLKLSKWFLKTLCITGFTKNLFTPALHVKLKTYIVKKQNKKKHCFRSIHSIHSPVLKHPPLDFQSNLGVTFNFWNPIKSCSQDNWRRINSVINLTLRDLQALKLHYNIKQSFQLFFFNYRYYYDFSICYKKRVTHTITNIS